jgi:hypothetical protein
MMDSERHKLKSIMKNTSPVIIEYVINTIVSKEVKELKQMQKIRTYRQKGNFIEENENQPDDTEVYDMIIDLSLLT